VHHAGVGCVAKIVTKPICDEVNEAFKQRASRKMHIHHLAYYPYHVDVLPLRAPSML
jgi:hypothetical protein